MAGIDEIYTFEGGFGESGARLEVESGGLEKLSQDGDIGLERFWWGRAKTGGEGYPKAWRVARLGGL